MHQQQQPERENKSDITPRKRLEMSQQQAKYQSLTRAALGMESLSSSSKSRSSSQRMMTLCFMGIAELPSSISKDFLGFDTGRRCLVLVEAQDKNGNEDDDSALTKRTSPQPCLLIPLLREAHVKPLEAAFVGKILSLPRLLRLNSIAVNRDEGLWDNLPWSKWTVDPDRRNYDAAGNPIDQKFHLGKRDAYNVMLGKDWFTFSSSSSSSSLFLPSKAVSLLADQLRQQQQQGEVYKDDEDNQAILAQRLLELHIREVEMDLAELDYQLAVQRAAVEFGNNGDDDVVVDISLEFQREELWSGLEMMKEQLQELSMEQTKRQKQTTGASSSSNGSSLVKRILDLVDKRRRAAEPAPYRGATGYAPFRLINDTNNQEEEWQFTSPFDMLVNIIKNQLKANVIGCVLENTSLLGGTITLGGAVVLQRQTPQKLVSILGQTVTVSDETQDFGNRGVQGGETFVVECEADEALGLSLACNLPLQVDQALFQQCNVMAQPEDDTINNKQSQKWRGKGGSQLPFWEPSDPELSILLEGQASNQSATSRVAPIRVPQSIMSLYDIILFQQNQQQRTLSGGTVNSSPLFPTDNPIQSLAQLDNLTDQDKAQTLLSMSNFQGRLPRPRVVRQAKANGVGNPLDDLLLPRIDESVRRQYLIRQAKAQGDETLVRELERSKSNRQRALEVAEQARNMGKDKQAQQWEQQAKFYESLRADVTQDEGSYSRFLDRDEWYERERRKHAAKIDKKKFGTLLDGIE